MTSAEPSAAASAELAPDRLAYSVGDYLMDRLAELGVGHVFGVPGDYSLGLLDHVAHHKRVAWVGCTNELNAGYAADGYGRIRGIAALCTTFGVGELSAINALSGSFAEFVPVVHIVGAPARGAQAAHRIVHHTLGDGVFDHFAEMHHTITCARAILGNGNPADDTGEIDRVLIAVRDLRRPGYLLIPSDLAGAPCERPTSPLPRPVDPTDPGVATAFAAAATRLLDSAGSVDRVAALCGVLVHRWGAVHQLTDLLAAGPLTHATTLWAKTLVDESAAGFVGSYAGAVSDEVTRAAVEDAAALIVAGVEFTDLNTGLFTQVLQRSRMIEIGATQASVGDAVFAPLALPDALAALVPVVAALPDRGGDGTLPSSDGAPTLPGAVDAHGDPSDEPLSQQGLWSEVTRFLRSGDLVLADQGTSFYGIGPKRLPAGVTLLGQPLWASIGYTLPAMLGASLAAPGRRAVVLIGDGAAQMTVQEFSTAVARGLAPIVLVVDNSGYTVERAIHGADEPYNDIVAWDWTALPLVFAPGSQATGIRVQTAAELRTALERARESSAATVVQAVVPPTDVPPLLDALTKALARVNAAPPDSG